MTNTTSSIFDQFTRQYVLSKTLRFELKPVGETEEMLIANKIIDIDWNRKERYEKTKPFIDKLHQEFISESLSGVTLQSLNGYDDIYTSWKTDRNNKEKLDQLKAKEQEIRKEVSSFFDRKATQWIQDFSNNTKLKKSNHEFLFEPAVFSILQQKYGSDPEARVDGKSIFESWDKWSAYFGKFFETRKNFYKSDGTATAVATRIVNDNLRRFCDNIAAFKSVKEKIDLSQLEKELQVDFDQILRLEHYTTCLTQKGIDAFNLLIGGTKDQKVRGLNQYINEYKQRTGDKLSRLKKLDKQIGSDKEDFLDFIETDEQLRQQLIKFVSTAKEKINIFDKSVASLVERQGNLAGLYFRKEAINTITRRWFANYEKISNALISAFQEKGDRNVKFDFKSEEYRFPAFVGWDIIKSAVETLVEGDSEEREKIWKDHYYENNPELENLTPWQQFLFVFHHEYVDLKLNGHKKEGKPLDDLVNDIQQLLAHDTFEHSQNSTEIIKNFADRVLNIYRLAKYFSLDKSRQWNPDGLETDDFYIEYEQFYTDSHEKIFKVYDKVRNYLSKKPFNQDKWKLNFENPTLADGWDKNKEVDNTSVILRKDDKYYLGVMDKKNNTLFKKFPVSTSGYQKMVYKLFPDPAKMMPKVCFSQKGLKFFEPEEEILRIYRNGEFKKGDTFSLSSMHRLIDFYKVALKTYKGWRVYNFNKVKETKAYTDNIGEFYRDVAESGYLIDFEYVSEEYIEEANKEGKLYLFEIHNKDWNLKDGAKKTGLKNTHTLCFEQVFSEENAKSNFVVKLNGEAELFFRPATSEEKLGTRHDSKGKLVTKNKRYAKNKMFFHVPITLNRTASDAQKFNQSINRFLANNPEINIIGIDRGEKHLAYLSVINQQGEILEIRSLNKINKINYASLLEDRAKNREKARRDWKSVEQIKDLKKGYISHVVHDIADLVIKYNAIVVLEDLNMRFKQVRGGIEKSIYQQLEKALIDKLNFLVNKKEIDPNKAGHVLRAYQLTAPFETFRDIGKQTGVLFYTQAEYTSQTDPVSGFRKNIYIGNSETVEKIKKFIKKMDEIGWDDAIQSYYFKYSPLNFVDGKFKDNTFSTPWTVYAKVPRIKRENRNGYWETIAVNPNDKFLELFSRWGFDNIHAGDIKDQIFQMLVEGRLNGTKEFDGKNRNFWQSFIYLFNLTLQVRNSTTTQYKKDTNGNVIETIDGVDFLASPVKPFFCTDGGKYTKGFVNLAGLEAKFIGKIEDKERFIAEFNGDANGAYNIARKGILLLERVAKSEKPDLFISKFDWDKFTQKTASR